MIKIIFYLFFHTSWEYIPYFLSYDRIVYIIKLLTSLDKELVTLKSMILAVQSHILF